jgi:hypothetical protein
MGKCGFEGCKRKIPLTAYPCKCKLVFCDLHRFYKDHKCTYNYFDEGQKRMKDNLSSIVFTKKELLQIG